MAIPDSEVFKEALTACPLGIAVETLDGQPIFVNPALCLTLGYSEEEMCGKHLAEFSSAEDAQKDSALLEGLRRGSIDHYQVEKKFFRQDGSLIWGRLTVSLLKGRSSPLVVAMMEDITEHKRAEEEIKESQQRFSLAAQAGKMYSFEWDVPTDVVVRSREHTGVLGVKEPLHISHQQFVDKVHPDDRPKLMSAIASLTPEHPTCNLTYRLLVSNDAVVWIRSNGLAFFDGKRRMLRLIGMVADVTDQKIAEEALRASEERLRLAQKVARIGSFERNIRTGVNTWTPEMESMYGLPPGGFGQTRTAFENLIHTDDRAEVIKLVDGALKTGQPTKGEWRVIWPDGSIHWIAGRWQALFDECGEPARVVGVNIDITERKQAEALLSDMTRKLVEAQEQERARIARELHDDISQRIALLAVELEQLKENPSQLRDRVQGLQNQVSEISTDVQALSHDLHSSKLEHLGAVAAMKSWCREFGGRQNMDVDFRSEIVSSLSLEIGRTLFRVLQEAVQNATKHSGVKRVEAHLAEDSGEIHLTIRDLGKGFDLEAAMQGKGLGLTSMRERVRLVNGTITVASKPTAGTTIHVCVQLGQIF